MSETTETRGPELKSLAQVLAEMPAPVQKAKTLDEFLEVNSWYYNHKYLRSRRVWIDKNDILCIDVFGEGDHSYYWIEKNRRKTAAQMWEWTQHMHGKTWMTPEIMYDFIYLCGRPK